MNRGQLKLRVSRITGLAIGTSDDELDEDDLLNTLANDAVRDILLRTRLNVRHGQVTLAQGSTEFEIDQSILNITRMARGATMLQTEDDGFNVSTDGYVFEGYNRLILGTAGANDALDLWYTPLPTEMTLDSHDPSIPAYGNIPIAFHPAILDYMCWWASDKSGDQSAGRGEKYRVMYEGQDGMAGPGSWLGRIKYATNRRAGATRVKRARELLNSDADARFWG